MFFQRRQEPSILSLCFPSSYKCNGWVLLSENSISFMVVQNVKNLPAMQETWVWSLGWEGHLEKREWLPTQGFLPGEFHGQRSLAGYSSWDYRESDTAEY